MARPRIHDLPTNLYVSKGAYRYKLSTGREVYLGADKERALRYAEAANKNRVGIVTQLHKRAMKLIESLPDEQEIIALSQRFAIQCGIYFLIHKGSVVYVGQSENCHARIGDHTRGEYSKMFDSYHVIECHKSNLHKMEALFIAKLNPRLNISKGATDIRFTRAEIG
ncbi:hypothetical protein B382_23613 [Stutzerimonas stutzeri B1SMN1]|nr:hypothetical protein B382_23613 [Stutzerimonas stutzeri B1SMN1]